MGGFSQLLLIAAMHGLVLGGVLFTYRKNHHANCYLAVFVALTATLLFDLFLYLNPSYYLALPHWLAMSDALSFLYGPFLYFYVLALTTPHWQWRFSYNVHFLPMLLSIAVLVPYFILPVEDKRLFIRFMVEDSSMSEIAHLQLELWIGLIHSILVTIQLLIYFYFIMRQFTAYRWLIGNLYSNHRRITLRWMQHMIITIYLMYMAFVVCIYTPVVNAEWFGMTYQYAYPFFGLVDGFFISMMGYMALVQPAIFKSIALDDLPKRSSPQVKQQRFTEPDQLKELAGKLLNLMEAEKLYLTQDLTVQQLAHQMHLSAAEVVAIIHDYFHKDFYNFVNTYRVEHAIELMKGNQGNRLSMLTIGLNSGFATYASFYNVFKNHINSTPAKYQESLFAAIHSPA